MDCKQLKQSACWNCKHCGMLQRLGWVKCYKQNKEHIRPVYKCDSKEKSEVQNA
jgi:hypothetical protein